ncbi:MAG: hypothetical protein M3O70_11150 [Actinomycetota bacterium]|nr:hypothetical protein [Actinomycetota bacterium]
MLFHHGLPKPEHALCSQETRAWLGRVDLPTPSRLLVFTGLGEIDAVDVRLDPIQAWLRVYAA